MPQHGINKQTFHRRKSKYGGMTPSDAAKLKKLEDENRRLKRLLAETMLDVSALNGRDENKLSRPVERREVAFR